MRKYTADAAQQNATKATPVPASVPPSYRSAASGAAATSTFFTHWRGRAVRTRPPSLVDGATGAVLVMLTGGPPAVADP
ncbi:hypothetical protein Amac_059860 [Acrocarpospora macrocephala]|uniref:Uncharacterized protein n=1 Tax=Acrocarpospora macrocephala TaxID=150177 RepID=A0A5M3WWS3_9ACTN|nr:hypothetical protein Amac_059860 [Acrocarpospora macrocephala]